MERYLKKSVGSKFLEIRKVLGLNQREFAEKINVSSNTISDIEKGKCIASERVISLLFKNCAEGKALLEEEFGDIFNELQ